MEFYLRFELLVVKTYVNNIIGRFKFSHLQRNNSEDTNVNS